MSQQNARAPLTRTDVENISEACQKLVPCDELRYLARKDVYEQTSKHHSLTDLERAMIDKAADDFIDNFHAKYGKTARGITREGAREIFVQLRELAILNRRYQLP